MVVQMGLDTISHMLNQWIESDEEDVLLCTMSRGGNVVRNSGKKGVLLLYYDIKIITLSNSL